MMYALIQNNTVVGILKNENNEIESITRFFQSVYEYDETVLRVEIGWIYDGSRLISLAGYQGETKITRLAFRKRFTDLEKGTIYTAAKTSVGFQVWLDDLAASTYVDLTRSDTIATVAALAAYGIIQASRKNIILDTSTITEDERYKERISG